MSGFAPQRSSRFLVAVVVGVLAGVLIGAALRERLMRRGLDPAEKRAASRAQVLAPPVDSVAWRYALALQRGDWAGAVGMTLWMQERMRRVQAQSGKADAGTVERAGLMAELSRREVAGNRLRAEGVEDQYVFTPDAALVCVGRDGGRGDLERAAAERLWIEVSYPNRERALRDAGGAPIRGLRVGVNVSPDGHVLKANVIGNLEIDAKTIRYDWDSGSHGE